MLITKKFRFEAAHRLDNYKGKCEQFHGHSYVLEVTFAGKPQKDGMIIDFSEIKKIVENKVISKLDHTDLNKIIKVTTCENVAKWIWEELTEFNPYEVTLYETPDSWITYRGE